MALLYVIFLLLLLLCFLCKLINGQIDLPNNDELILAKTAAHLVRNYYFQESTITVLVIERSFYSESKDFNKRTLEYILKNLNETIAVQMYNGKSENQPWEYHVLIVDSVEAFLNITWDIPENDFDADFRFLIILTNSSSTNYFQTIEAIFKACKDNNVINVNILLDHHILGVCMYQYRIFSETKCHVVQPYLHFRLDDGFEKLTEIFPQKLRNFHQCPLKICGQLNRPMLTYLGNVSDPKQDAKDKYWTNLGGIDGQLIRMLSGSLNFTIDLIPLTQERSYIENKTGFGCFAKLLDYDADIAIGGFSGSDPNRTELTPSIIYHNSPIVFIVRGKREMDSANRLGRPFSIPVWQSIIGLLLAGAFLIQILRFLKPLHRQLIVGEQNDTPLLNYFAVFLGYPVVRVPEGILPRYLLILWLVMTLIIRSAYQGSLYDSIRIDRFEKIPQKFEDLLKKNYKFIIPKQYLDIGIFPRNQTIIFNRLHYKRLKLLAILEGNYATGAIRDHVVSYLELNYRKGSDLRIVDEQIYQYQTAMYFTKHSIYATPFNEDLKQFNYAGIIMNIVRHTAKDRRIFIDDYKKQKVPLRAMTNERIWSLYQIFVWLMIVTVAVFIMEWVSDYFLKLQVILNWFH